MQIKNNKVEDNVIIPQRFIPFDIGVDISENILNILREYFNREYRLEGVPLLMTSISDYIALNVKITNNIRLYIYTYGIGVFVIEDEVFSIGEDYSVGYCKSRKKAHKELLEFTRDNVSEVVDKIINHTRQIAINNSKTVRGSASKEWEHNGLSYVMTVSYILMKKARWTNYEMLSEKEKIDLQILLQPSLAKMEDTMSIEQYEDDNKSFNPYNLDLDGLDEPHNWIKSEDCSVFISWASVIVGLNNLDRKRMELIECLEVDLQAMWLYTHCQNLTLKQSFHKGSKSVLELKREKYKFRRRYNEFKNETDTSVPVYITEIKQELIRTSGIEKEMDNYMEYLEYCIDESISKEAEHQKKYAKMSEVLLFIIAFIQTAPLVYDLISGDVEKPKIIPTIIIVLTLILGVWFIFRKE